MARLRLPLFLSLTLLLLLASCIQLTHATDLELNTSVQDGSKVDQPPSGPLTIPGEEAFTEVESAPPPATPSEPVTPAASQPPRPVADSRTKRLDSLSKSSRDRVAKSRKSVAPGSQPQPVPTPLLANQPLSGSAPTDATNGLKSLSSNGSKASFTKVVRSPPSSSSAVNDGLPKSPKRKQPTSSSTSSGKSPTRKAPTNKPARKSDLKTNEERQAAIRAKVNNELKRRQQIALDEQKRGQPTSTVNPPSTVSSGSQSSERKKPKVSKSTEPTSSSSSSLTEETTSTDRIESSIARPSLDRQKGLPSSTRRNGSNAPASNENAVNDFDKPKSKKLKAKSSDSSDIGAVIREKITQPVSDPQPPAPSSSPVDDQIDKFERELAAKKSTSPSVSTPSTSVPPEAEVVETKIDHIVEKLDDQGNVIEVKETKVIRKTIPFDQSASEASAESPVASLSTPSDKPAPSHDEAASSENKDADDSQSQSSEETKTPSTTTNIESTSTIAENTKPSGVNSELASSSEESSSKLPEIPADEPAETSNSQTQPATPTPVSGPTTKEEHLAPSNPSVEATPSTPIPTIPDPDNDSSSKEVTKATSATEKTESKPPTPDSPPALVAPSTPEPTLPTPTPSGPIVVNLTPVAPATPLEVTPVVIDEDQVTPASTVPKSELKEDPSASTNEEVIKAPIKPPTDPDSLVSNDTPAVDNTPAVDTWKPVTPPRASSHTGLVIVFVLLSFLLFVGYKLKRCLASGDEDSEDRDLESGTLLSNGSKRSAPIIKPGSGQVIIDALTDDEDPEEAYQKKRLLQQQDASSTSTNASSRGMSLKASVPLKPQRTTSAKKTKVSLGARQLSDNED